MARTDALSIFLANGSTEAKLAEEYGKVVENLQHVTVASRLKNQDLSGDPTAGSVEAKRFLYVEGKAYGTARGNSYADKVRAVPVTVNIDDKTEFIEEVNQGDVAMYGIDGLIERRAKNHQDALAVELDVKFLGKAVQKGTPFIPTASDIEDEIEEAIQTIESKVNDYVKGVPRHKIKIVANPRTYGKLRNAINAIPNSNDLGQVANWEGGLFNNVEIYSSVFLPVTADYVVMAEGAVAQPVRVSVYNPQIIPLSDEIGFGLFAYKGTKEVMEELIIYKASGITA